MLGQAAVAAPLFSSTNFAQTGIPESSKQAALPETPASPTIIHVFSKPLHQMSYAEAARLVAETGYDGIDYTVRRPQGHVLPARVKEDLPRAIDAAHAEGLQVEMITTEITSARDPHAETLLRTAASLGVKYYRLGNLKYDATLGVVRTLEKMKPVLAELAALNASLGIHGALQNHSGTGIGGPVWDLFELVRDADPRWLGVQYDIRHATAEGGQSWPLGLKLLRPWIRCVDIKDFRWQQTPGKAVIEDTPLGEGIVPFDAYFKLLHELGFNGPMSMHLEYPPFERAPQPLGKEEQRAQFSAAMKKDLDTLRAAMTNNGMA